MQGALALAEGGGLGAPIPIGTVATVGTGKYPISGFRTLDRAATIYRNTSTVHQRPAASGPVAAAAARGLSDAPQIELVLLETCGVFIYNA